jgi:hypothetical protein
MERLANFVSHHRRLVIGAWVLLTLLEGFSAGTWPGTPSTAMLPAMH